MVKSIGWVLLRWVLEGTDFCVLMAVILAHLRQLG